MHFIFADDSRQRKPSRMRMGPLVAIGGIIIADEALHNLESEVNSLCQEAGFPPGEVFKWSPDSKMWMHKNLIKSEREAFFHRLLAITAQHGTKGLVVIEDTTKNTATDASNAEEDVLQLFLERVNNQLSSIGSEGIVIVSRPSGDRRSEDGFLDKCVDALASGTTYVQYSKISLNILSVPSRFVRLLQVADIIASCSVAMVAGETQFAPSIFSSIKPLLLSNFGYIGGTGLKIHPDLSYGNLYHWLLGDTHIKKGNSGHPLPIKTLPYSTSSDKY